MQNFLPLVRVVARQQFIYQAERKFIDQPFNSRQWACMPPHLHSVVDSSYFKGWCLKDQSIIVALKTTSNKTEVRKEGDRPPFYPLATTLLKLLALELLCINN